MGEIIDKVAGALRSFDWAGLENDLASAVFEIGIPVLKAEGQDLREFGLAIARDMVSALRTGDTAWRQELKDQARTVLEISRIRVNAADLEMFERITATIFKIALAGLKAAA